MAPCHILCCMHCPTFHQTRTRHRESLNIPPFLLTLEYCCVRINELWADFNKLRHCKAKQHSFIFVFICGICAEHNFRVNSPLSLLLTSYYGFSLNDAFSVCVCHVPEGTILQCIDPHSLRKILCLLMNGCWASIAPRTQPGVRISEHEHAPLEIRSKIDSWFCMTLVMVS